MSISHAVFITLSLIVAITSFIIAAMAFSKRRKDGFYLGVTLFFAGCINIFYLGNILASDRFVMSVYSSIYFALIDLVLLSLLMYVREFINNTSRITLPILGAFTYATFDIVTLLVNPWNEFVLTYRYAPDAVAHWKFVVHPLFNMHLMFSYVLVAAIFIYILRKILITPEVYRSRYLVMLASFLIVIITNAVFLFVPENNFADYSVHLYSIGGFIFYWNNYNYARTSMLNKTREIMVDELKHPICLFDYEKNLVYFNMAAINAFEQHSFNLRDTETLGKFIENCGFDEISEATEDSVSFKWIMRKPSSNAVYRCDYHVLKDGKERIIGYLFMFADNSAQLDVLTGFHSVTEFNRHFRHDEGAVVYPLAITVCDINNLSAINRACGYATGDMLIKRLAQLMVAYFPDDTYFARLDEANLIAVCSLQNRRELRDITTHINTELLNAGEKMASASIQYSTSIADGEKVDVIKATEISVSSMRAKKLLDSNSAHSSLLDSLVQTLYESDDETEAHVQRTNELGQKLAEKLNLSDQEKNDLALLCLLHDIGKVGIPLEILNKPGKLNSEEWQIMKSHAEKGARIASASSELVHIADLILHHHERWDGNGYPYGLKGEQIPLLSRIIAIVDTYDAITSDRVYRKAMPHKDAIAEIKRCAGVQFDPVLVDELMSILKENFDETLGVDSVEQVPASDIDKKPAGVEEVIVKNSYKKSRSKTLLYSRYILNSNDEIIEVDDNFEKLTGYSWADVLRLKLTQSDLIPEEDREEYNAIVEKSTHEHQEAYIEHRLQRADSRLITVHCIGTLFFNAVSKEGRADIIITQVSDPQTEQ